MTKILYITEDQKTEEREIENTLEAMQAIVEGWIECVTIAPAHDDRTGVIAICNEEGRIRDMPYRCTINGIDFYGPVFLIGTEEDAEDFVDVPPLAVLILKGGHADE